VGPDRYAAWLGAVATGTLSLYVHVPFCAELCLYCGCHTKAVRRQEPLDRYAGDLINEVSLVARRIGRRQVSHLHWGGGTPSILGADRLIEVADHIATGLDIGTRCEHAIELDPRYVDRPLARIGVNRASLGVQCFSPEVQEAIGRRQPYQRVVGAIDALREFGIARINLDLMYGLPRQTVVDIRRNVSLAAGLKPDRIALFGYAHVPWFRPQQRLIETAALPGPAARLEQTEAARAALIGLGYEPIGFDHFALPHDELAVAARAGRLRRNFQGYTTDDADALIGIGASAIGRLAAGFVQNAPDVAGYSRAVAAGRFATARGVALTQADRLRGRIIERLMCDLAADLAAIAAQCGADEAFVAERVALAPLVCDGLVRLVGDEVAISEKGRPFVRLIASVFDAYLQQGRARHSIAV